MLEYRVDAFSSQLNFAAKGSKEVIIRYLIDTY
jgi:hypothetical protein